MVGGALVAFVSLFAGSALLFPLLLSPATQWALPVFAMVGAVGQIVPPIAVAAICRRVGNQLPRGSDRSSWRYLSTAYTLTGLLACAWAALGLFDQSHVLAVSPQRLAWLLTYPLVFVALLLQMPSAHDVHRRLTAMLDALLFTLGIAGLAWTFLWMPSIADAGRSLGILFVFVYPLGDLLIAFALISMVFRWRLGEVPTSALYLVAALAAQIIADAGHGLVSLDGSYVAGHGVDALWSLGYTLVGLAGLVRWREGDRAQPAGPPRSRYPDLSWMARTRVVLPYLVLPAAGALLYVEYSPRWGSSASPGPGAVTAFALVVLVMVRQFVVLVENDQLSRSLASLSREQEARVAERTEELVTRTLELTARTEQLTALNRVATRLGQCTTPSEVLTTGLELASEASGVRTGAVWLPGAGEKVEQAAYRGRFGQMESLLAELPSQVPDLRERLLASTPSVIRGAELDRCWSPAGPDAPRLSFLVLVPLLSRRTALGAMSLAGLADEVRREPDLDLVQSIGAQVGVALENARRYDDARKLAELDPVTGLHNHRALHRRLDEELSHSQDAGLPLSVVMMDLDGFRLFNDTYGHPAGDRMLRMVAGVLTMSARTEDVVGRYGGDEFMAILPSADAQGAISFAERVRKALREHPYFDEEGLGVPIQMSFGVATSPENGRKGNELAGFADANLYESKHRGGDTVTVGNALSGSDVPRAGRFGVLDGLVTAVDNKDHYTRQHSEDVAYYALGIAQAMGLSEESQRTLRIAALLHDVGKIGVPDRILRKPARLDEEESAAIQQHALLGEMIIKDVPNIGDVLAAVGAHHERFDGRGYPRGLRGSRIPLLGRILAVADSFSAMTTDRPYRKGKNPIDAKEELLRVAGSQLDPDVVRTFLRFLATESVEEEVRP